MYAFRVFVPVALVACLVTACMEPSSPADDIQSAASQQIKNALRVDAALEGGGSFAGFTYLFRGAKYRRMTFSTGVFDEGGSLPLFAFHLPDAYQSGVDAALAGAGAYADKAYFFLGANYARYDWATNRVDWQGTLGGNWNLPAPFSSGIEAAVNGEGAYLGKAFFFKGDQYVRYD